MSIPSEDFKLVLMPCIANQVVEQTQVLDVGQYKPFVYLTCMLKSNCNANFRASRAKMHEDAFGIFIIWDETIETGHNENTCGTF